MLSLILIQILPESFTDYGVYISFHIVPVSVLGIHTLLSISRVLVQEYWAGPGTDAGVR